MKEEKWKDIPGYNYAVSTAGGIKRTDTGAIVTPWFNKDGYPCVSLSEKGKVRKFRVHRLVAEAFIPNPDNRPYVDHINTDHTDSRVENLRWVTPKGNSNNPLTLERLRKTTFKAGDANPKTMTGKFGKDNPVSIPVEQLKDGQVVATHESARRAMVATRIDCTSITKVCRGQRKSAGGFGWRYAK